MTLVHSSLPSYFSIDFSVSFLGMCFFFSNPFYFCFIWAVAEIKNIKNSSCVSYLTPGTLIYSVCHCFVVMTLSNGAKTKGNEKNDWPKQEQNGRLSGAIAKHGRWQAAEFIIKVTLENQKKMFIILFLRIKKVIWPQTYGKFLFSCTYLHNASILASVV